MSFKSVIKHQVKNHMQFRSSLWFAWHI